MNGVFETVGGCDHILEHHTCEQSLFSLDEIFDEHTLILDICVKSCLQCPGDHGNYFVLYFTKIQLISNKLKK